jgi:hypothetical protein
MNKMEFDEVRELSLFLERFIPEIKKTKSIMTYAFPKQDQATWKKFYNDLILTNVLPDGTAFGGKDATGNLGVGQDGSSSAAEFYQLLMQCYKYMYQALSAGEVYLKYNGWYLAQKEGNEDDDADSNAGEV